MPLLTAKPGRLCDERNPCRRYSNRCPRCNAADGLERSDWYILGFYRRVDDQYINQSPMGVAKDSPMCLTPRLEAWESALRIWGYPEDIWPWLVHWTVLLHRLRHGLVRRESTPEVRAHLRSLGVKGA